MTDKVLLCAIAKQENKYIREWVDYHLNLGFDHITIYDNNDTGGERISDALSGDMRVNIVDFRGKKQKSCETQVEAYNHCYKNAKNYTWVLFIDIDEFLWFRDYDNIKVFLAQNWVRKANVIRFHWKCYSDNNQLYYEDRPVMERFTEPCSNVEVNYHTKQMYRTNLGTLRIVNVHYSTNVSYIFYPDGKPAPYTTSTKDSNIHDEIAHIKHYVTKSLEEYVRIKWARRCEGSSKTRLSMDFYFKYNKRTDEKVRYYRQLMNELKNAKAPVSAVKKTSSTSEPYMAMALCPGAKTRPAKPVTESAKIAQISAYNPKDDNVYPFGVSVCISAWKTAEYIEECLDSVAAQTWFKDHDNYEILLGIDGCEETLAKVKDIMQKYKNLKVMMMDKNVGTYVTSNTIMKEAKYEWLLRFDSDDVMHPNMVEELMKYANNETDIVLPRAKNFGTMTNDIGTAHGSMLMLHTMFEKFGGYKSWKCAADTELKTRLQKIVKIKDCTEILFKRRTHKNSLTRKIETSMFSPLRKKYHTQIKVAENEDDAKTEMKIVSFYEVTPFIIDKITHNKPLICKNKTHILIVDYKQLNYTKQIIDDIVEQDTPFDLTIFEQECDDETNEYLNELKSKWALNGCELNIVRNEVNAPLNHIWNWFYENTTNQYLAILNNDIRVCDNFVSDAEKIFEAESECGIIVHPTNRSEFTKQTKLTYETSDKKPLLQGWDFIIRRDLYSPIPQKLWVYGGDNYIFAEVLKCDQKVFYDISSPIIHYRSSTIKNIRDAIEPILMNDRAFVKKLQINKSLSDKIDNKYTKRDFTEYFQLDKTKKICYTAITGDYDTLNDPVVITSGWKYICFTNSKNIKSSVWEIVPLPTELTKLSNVKAQRMLKLCPHRYLPKYYECVWVDGSITIQCDLNFFTKKHCNEDFCIVKHPARNCIYEECDAIVKRKKDTQEHADEIRNKLESEGFPHNFGLAETGLIYRRNTDFAKQICEEWGKQMLSNGTHRDQLTFNYVLWKLGATIKYLPSDTVRNGKLFKLNEHNTKK